MHTAPMPTSTEKNFFYYLLPSIVSVLLGLVMMPITTFFLEPRDFGLFALLTLYSSVLTVISSTGATWVICGHFFTLKIEERKGLIFNVLVVDCAVKFFWLAVFWLAAPVALPFLIRDFDSYYTSYFYLLLLATVMSSLTGLISYILILQKRARTHAIVEIAGPISNALIVSTSLVILKFGMLSLVFGQLGAEILSLLLGLMAIRAHIFFKLRRIWARAILRHGLPSIPVDLVGFLGNSADRYFIQRWMDLSSLGIYSHSMNYRNIFSLGFKAFNRTYAPRALEHFSLQEPSGELHMPLKRWIGLTTIGGILVTLFAYDAIDLLTHGKFVAAAKLVPLWYLLILSYAYGTTYIQYLFANKRNFYLSIAGVLVGLVSIVATGFAVYRFGAIGATVAAVGTNFLSQLSYAAYARKLGCLSVGRNYFLFAALLLLLLYSIVNSMTIHLGLRIAGAIGLCIGIVALYDMKEILFTYSARTLSFLRKRL